MDLRKLEIYFISNSYHAIAFSATASILFAIAKSRLRDHLEEAARKYHAGVIKMRYGSYAAAGLVAVAVNILTYSTVLFA